MSGLNLRGFASPFRFGPAGHANRAKGLKRIEENLIGIALTKKGEHVRERAFGTIGYGMVLRNLNTAGLALITSLSEDAFAEYEPNAAVSRVTWERTATQDGSALYLKVPYFVKELTGSETNSGTAEAKIGE